MSRALLFAELDPFRAEEKNWSATVSQPRIPPCNRC